MNRTVSCRFVALGLLAAVAVSPVAAQQSKKTARFEKLGNDQALQRLAYRQPRLPSWARMLAVPLPNTAAAMLRLDYIHRAESPLDPVLRAKIRWAAADALGCEYSKRVAVFDLRRTGIRADAIRAFTQTGKSDSAGEQMAVKLARKLTLAGHSVTDEEIAQLTKHFGAKKLVAMVHTVAHANFQDRIFLALGVKPAADEPLAPLNLQTRRQRQRDGQVKRKPWKEVQAANKDKTKRGPGWDNRSYAELQKALAAQQKRTTRIALPETPQGRKGRRRRSPVRWNTVSMTYAPKLTQAWFRCMSTFHRESQLDRVFANSMFWVVTRSNECFY